MIFLPLIISNLINHVLAPVGDSLESAVAVHSLVQPRAHFIRELHQAESLSIWILDERDHRVWSRRDTLIIVRVKAELTVAFHNSFHFAGECVV